MHCSSYSCIKDSMSAFAKDYLICQLTLEYYQKLMGIVIIFIGSVPLNSIHFRVPVGLYNAHWMAKALNAIKIWMFSKQFSLTRKTMNSKTWLSL
jgi:hypothetical protein